MGSITISEGDHLEINGGMIYHNFIYAGNISSVGTVTSLLGGSAPAPTGSRLAALESCDAAMAFFDSLPVRPKIVGTSAHGTALIDEVDMTGPVALVVGNETFGLSKAWKERCDVLAKIPIYGAASSLNVGCAATACLYEIARQRRQGAER